MTTQQIVGKLQKLLHQHEENSKTRQSGLLNSIRDIDRPTEELTLSELHVIACIGKHGQVNVTAISQEMDMTRGAISKISTKLLKRGYLVKKQKADNQKEVHFQLTSMGAEIFRLHEELHEQAERRIERFLQKYSSSELAFIDRLLTDAIAEHKSKQTE
ncbi:MarR family transcriptional regulator [Brevibacillus laterosporus]|uniref:MarR family transcriptional regulator n=1 Tax=Brevibacillus laterosporus TaxID=1465 RepID=UPI0003720525|nr:MarR family transcriptional regulator [Brevibacillus laterosporus]ATO50821.1 MarR family transcriptional regulator [Brevibacillus laterosporus DSM 25]MBG9804484.1 MarR family transcriptional regulator [Brevibacillus laterosporus]MED2003011.1 MarR family transcriptional regulator [Brevibacillus laterosporus]MED4763991.1 MarR family transcriptional regulator [Brevibacillus laterosporus]TPH17023.1 MarR family transcriptional regulator [Brevibacillus laterosporus]